VAPNSGKVRQNPAGCAGRCLSRVSAAAGAGTWPAGARHPGYKYTVCLQGGYTDETGNYGVGDFAVGPGAERHEPIADPGEPCIALLVVEKPIILTSSWGRLLNPLVSRGII
jgi:predicted ChrR family anti-sigma factor